MTWVYGEDGEPAELPLGSGNKWLNEHCLTPCGECPKIPKGAPKDRRYAIEPTERSWKIYQHWRECRAVGHFPEDGLVKRHASILQSIQDELDAQPMAQLTQLLMVKRAVDK